MQCTRDPPDSVSQTRAWESPLANATRPLPEAVEGVPGTAAPPVRSANLYLEPWPGNMLPNVIWPRISPATQRGRGSVHQTQE